MNKKKLYVRPLLAVLAVILCLVMIRLGFWQLDRADLKRMILDQSIASSEQASVDLSSIEFQGELNNLRFRQVSAQGEYLTDQTIYIDNQVYESKVGYALITPFRLVNSNKVVLVDHGWIAVGESRAILPEFTVLEGIQLLNGRLNFPYQQPPLWNDKYDVADGKVWQYLPIDEFQRQTGLDVLPLVVELVPQINANNVESEPIVNWQSIDDEWVYKHQAYAFQWFSMAFVFFIACLILLIKSISNSKESSTHE